MSQIIGLLGARYAGKSVVANYLVERHGFTRLRFADGVKNMLRTLGLTEAQVDGAEKEDPIPLLGGRSYRDAATTLGTSWGRDTMDKGLWVRALEQRLLALILANEDVKVVVDDVRYMNEYKMLERYNAVFATVRRPCVEPHWNMLQKMLIRCGRFRPAHVHSSEVLYRLVKTEFELFNDEGMEELHEAIETLLASVPDTQLELVT